MSLQIVKHKLGQDKKTILRTTTVMDYEEDLCNELEQMELDGYVQCEASKEQMEQWDKMYKDWVVVCDSEYEEDRILIYVK